MRRTGFKPKSLDDKLSQLSKPRKKLRQVSKKKAQWNKLYKLAKEEDHFFQRCAKCNLGDRKEGLECHHPFGRIGKRILAYVYLCQRCHDWIHSNGRVARDLGWLQPEFDGRPPDQSVPKPWP